MCVSRSGIETQAAKTASLADMMTADFGSRFKDQTDVLNQLRSTITGPSGRGFSPEEKAAYESTALTSSAAANVAAQREAQGFGAGRGGGGTSGLVSGISKQINAEIASQQAGALAGQQLGIEKADWATGREEKWRKAGGLETLAGEYHPEAYGQMAGQERQQAYSAEKDIFALKQAKQKAIGGLIGGVAMTALTGGLGGIAGMGAMGGGIGGFAKAGLNTLAGQNVFQGPAPAVGDPGFGIDIPTIG